MYVNHRWTNIVLLEAMTKNVINSFGTISSGILCLPSNKKKQTFLTSKLRCENLFRPIFFRLTYQRICRKYLRHKLTYEAYELPALGLSLLYI